MVNAILALHPAVRYAACYQDGKLHTVSRSGTTGASAAESDRYEELIVNPTLLTLVKQRGEIDCGGMQYVVVRYGNFFQLVQPLPDGHISVCIEASADPLAIAELVAAFLRETT